MAVSKRGSPAHNAGVFEPAITPIAHLKAFRRGKGMLNWERDDIAF
ncbi:MAG: hypothetical protein QXP23_01405 [Fervidicoccaceae archaeon]